ncbi:hypothetical protein HBI53_149330 [Parastagonospora nodorum]|nr:hypothetical protein HBI53_149330 [Parastagonospora nodorum]KAH6552928.1 hypothetical protein HBI07_020610 [Parastagonospora nodorum]
MARCSTQKAGPPPQKSRRKMKQPTNEEQQHYVKRTEDAAVLESFKDAEAMTEPSLKSRLVARFGGHEEESNARPTLAAETRKSLDEEDNVAIPTPIDATIPWKIVAPDGRVRNIRQPIHGFEHLFDGPDDFQEVPNSGRSCNAPSFAYQPQLSQAPGQTPMLYTSECHLNSAAGTPQHMFAYNNHQQPRSKHLHEIKVPSKRKTVLKRNVLKRTRSVAQELAQHPSPHEATDDDQANTKSGGDELDNEVAVVTEASKTFHIGDIEALQVFFRQRIDELTMKPVRGMVTSWVKQLEPKRKGGYGPYHKMLPSEAPEDATPPWWPHNVPYIEPAHLDKDGLLSLAVEIMMQHRDVPIDEWKRQQSWSHKLRQVAQFEIEMTPQEQYSSSRNPAFSKLMKERAQNGIIPSLFDVSQSYEDHVNQYSLWSYKNIKDFPKGKAVTWQLVPRPPKQISHKRPRSAPRPRVKREEMIIEALVESSGDETEPDDTMYRLAAQIIRKKEAKEAQRKARAAAGFSTPTTRAPSVQRASREQTVEAPSPPVASQRSAPVTPQAEPQHRQDPIMDGGKPVVSASFDQSMDHLRLQDEANRGKFLQCQHRAQSTHLSGQSFDESLQNGGSASSRLEKKDAEEANLDTLSGQDQEVRRDMQALDELTHHNATPSPYLDTASKIDEDDAKEDFSSGPMSEDQQTHGDMPILDERMNYQEGQPVFVNTYQSPQGSGPYAGQEGSPFTQFTNNNFIDPTHMPMFSAFPMQMAQPYDHNMTSLNMHMVYPYSSDSAYNPMGVTASPAAVNSFGGLPYEFSGSQH